MVNVHVKTIHSVPQYLEFIESSQAGGSIKLWYRGCGLATYRLLPSLYRHKTQKTPDQLAELERQLMTRFRQRSVPYHSRSMIDDWDTLFFMQHYGIPTRLLDWTENPLTALHFALMGAKRTVTDSGKPFYQSSAAVWMLDPVMWNRHALRHMSYLGGVLSSDDPEIQGYGPKRAFVGMHNQVVALYGVHNSARIVAQQGVFTIFGRDAKPMEQAFNDDQFPAKCLTKITVPRSHISRMRKSLLNQGVTESAVFPDLEGLAREIKRLFGFEV